MSTADDPLIFYGRSSDEAETFIRQVNLLAFKAQKTRDAHWTADLASTAFAGDALRKFLRWAPEIRGDWNKLQEALLNEYPPSSAPMGAAAPPPPAYGAAGPMPAAGPLFQQGSNPSLSRSRTYTGRISFSTASGARTGYLSRNLDRYSGLLLTSQDPSQALEVRWTLSSQPTTFQILNCSSPFGYLGGVTRAATTKLGQESESGLALTTTTGPGDAPRGHPRLYKGRPTSGTPYAGIWNVLQDGTVIAIVRVEDTSYALSSVFAVTSNTISVVVCPKYYLAAHPPGNRLEARLVFEPM